MNRASARQPGAGSGDTGPGDTGPGDTRPASTEPSAQAGVLTVAAVPIGNPGDAAARLGPALASAGLIAAEDTRRLRRLATALGIRLTGRVVSYYDDVEARRVPVLLSELAAGQDVLLVTDAGLPGVSDPGYRLIAAAAQAGIRVTVLPGPSAVTTALVVSGLPGDRFAFEGFPSRRHGERDRRFAELAAERRTLIFFESPRRIGQTLAELAAAFGPDRRAVVCRELTKTHEEVLRGSLGELASQLAEGTLGEVTLVVAGATAGQDGQAALAAAVAQVRAHVQDGATTRDAVAAVAAATGLRKRDLYNAAAAAGAGVGAGASTQGQQRSL